jgi:hypothetical protein
MYPKINPIMPYNDVEAPALIASGSIKIENMFPPIPEIMYIRNALRGPTVY